MDRCSADDDLAYDPDYEPQSLRSWIEMDARNEVTKKRNAIYVIAPPEIDPEVDFVRTWASPRTGEGAKIATETTLYPVMEDIIAYLRAFYTGTTVKALRTRYQFTAWDSPSQTSRSQRRNPHPYIGLTTSSSIVRIRARPTPTTNSTFTPFSHQLNLNDLLDALIEDLPGDAYAIIMLVAHDLYEGDDDDFCMGRAYGGSRVAVVSMARYDPRLDEAQGIDSEHAWPASHCARFVDEQVAGRKRGSKARPKKKVKRGVGDLSSEQDGDEDKSEKAGSPMEEAVAAYQMRYREILECSPEDLLEIWLSRICRTASHELGHCFGMDHCVYYACNMQSTASLLEDGRQPPYPCPVDLAKLRHATGRTTEERFKAMYGFCGQHSKNPLFAAFGAWLSASIRAL